MKNRYILASLLFALTRFISAGQPCPLTWTFVSPTDDFISVTGYYEASQNIEASNLVAGTSTITYDAGVYVQLKPGFKAQTSSFFKALIDGCGGITAVETPGQHLAANIFPNPNTGTFTLELGRPAPLDLICRITDLTGRLLLEKSIDAGSSQHFIQADNLPRGLYLLQIISDGQILTTEKFIKQ